jgi:hypothetical protein
MLRAVPSILHVEFSADSSVIATPANPDVDPRPDIARAIVEKGWNLMELRPLAINLEEIFLEVTRQEQAESEDTLAEETAPEAVAESEAGS